MYLWTVPIISVILIFSYAIPGWSVRTNRKWVQIRNDLIFVNETLGKSIYWKYHKGLKLYSTSAETADTCEKSILHCYVQELKVVVEEVQLIGDEEAAQSLTKTIHDIEINGELDFPLNNGCKKCEEYEEKPIEEFIKDFENFSQKMQTLLE